MPIISIASPKGGCGKTTSTILLACELARRGAKVTIVDADKLEWSRQWADKAGCPENINVIAGMDELKVGTTALDAEEKSQIVLVDCEGTGNLGTVQAVGVSDLVIIPVQGGGSMDQTAGDLTLAMIKAEERKLRRPIQASVVFTRTNMVNQSSRQQVADRYRDMNVRVFNHPIADRKAFERLTRLGGDLVDLPKEELGSNPEAAFENASAFADEVIQMLREIQEERAA